MKIEYEKKKDKATIEDILPGECFRWHDTIYLMLWKCEYFITLNLETNLRATFLNKTEVEKVNCKILVSN